MSDMKTYDVAFSDKCRVHATSKSSAREKAREVLSETLMYEDDHLEVIELGKALEMSFKDKSKAFEKDLEALLEKYHFSMFIENEDFIGILDKDTGEDDYIEL